MSEGTFNPAARRLCPDGSCIGIVGDDNRCRVCGRAGDGAAAATAATAAGGSWRGDNGSDHDHAGHDDAGPDDDRFTAGSAVAAAGETEGGGGFRPDRRLCDDGSCVGVIGAGDVCSVCGRPAGS